MNGLMLALSVAATTPVAATYPNDIEYNGEISGLTAADIFALSDQALADSRATDARVLLAGLLSDRDVDVRNEAAFRLAKIEAASGQLREAAVRYRRILDEQPDAQPVRLELAALLAKMGDENAARREIRYARAGSLPPEVAQMVDRFSQTLRTSKPFGGSAQFGILSDSNINRATRSDTLGTVIGDFTLDEAAKERSGQGLSVDSQTFGRLPIGRHQLTLTLSQSSDLYQHKHFNDVSAALTVGPELSFKAARLNLSVGLARRWFGDHRFTNGGVAQAVVTAPISPSTQGRLALMASDLENHRNRLESGRNYSLGLELEKALSPRTGVGISLSAARRDLRDPGYSNRSAQFGLVSYRTFGRMTFIGAASVGRLVADERLLLYPTKRQDWTTKLSIGATFRKAEFMGFAPSAQFSWELNRSSIEIYEYRRTAVEFGMARAF